MIVNRTKKEDITGLSQEMKEPGHGPAWEDTKIVQHENNLKKKTARLKKQIIKTIVRIN